MFILRSQVVLRHHFHVVHVQQLLLGPRAVFLLLVLLQLFSLAVNAVQRVVDALNRLVLFGQVRQDCRLVQISSDYIPL